MDYPSIENFLAPLYATGASSNDSDYSNPKFDAKLKEAAAAPSLDEANKLYQEAEAILGEDLPVMPMWSYAAGIGLVRSSDRCEGHTVRDHRLDLDQGEVKESLMDR